MSPKDAGVKNGSLVRASALGAAACALVLSHAPAADARQEAQKPAAPAAESIRRPTVNTMPFVDFARKAKKMFEEGRIGPETTLDMSASAELSDSGGFKPESVRIQWRTLSNEDAALIAQYFLTAVSQSGILYGLRGEVKAVTLAVRVDRQNVAVDFAGETASEESAERLATAYSMLLVAARASSAGTNEGEMYRSVKFTSDGRQFKMSLETPKAAAARWVADALARREAREQRR
ncbi:MAG TPA: hypothetical protein VF508_01010 [Pyrinomonadaceae bacterium]|jgi:hypothetical protein